MLGPLKSPMHPNIVLDTILMYLFAYFLYFFGCETIWPKPWWAPKFARGYTSGAKTWKNYEKYSFFDQMGMRH